MRQRITYFLRDPADFNIDQVKVETDALSVTSLNAAKEHRFTLGLKELPHELEALLAQFHELHIRWTRPGPYSTITPLVSRASPGIHVFSTPREGRPQDRFCPIFQKVFGRQLKCSSPEDTFTGVPVLSERFSTGAALQYHQSLPDLNDLILYLEHKACGGAIQQCIRQVRSLETVSYLDIDFDIISHALLINAFWDASPVSTGWTETVHQRNYAEQIEVGILNSEPPVEPEELKLGGFLTIIGEDTKPGATLFAFPARHHPLAADSTTTYTTSFRQPTGLHPTLQLKFPPQSLSPPSDTCALHTYLTLPSYLFIDKYQLSDPLFLSSQHLTALHSIAGETDLEAPDWVIRKWGSAALLELATPPCSLTDASPKCPKEDHTVSIPLHLRYLPPTNQTNGLTSVPVPWPVVFWACTADEGTKMAVNPFDRVNLGYDGLFGPRTMFYHVPPEVKTDGAKLVETIDVPVLQLHEARYVEMGTVVAVVLGSLWVLWKLLGVWRRTEHAGVGQKKTQ